MIPPLRILLLLSTAGVPREPADRAAIAPPAPAYLSSQRILVAPHTDETAPFERLELWISRDTGRSWTLASAPIHERRAQYEAPEDGRYDLFVRLFNAAGASGPPPTTGAAPTATVIVDTIPPLLQLHEARACAAPGEPRSIQLRLSVFDENLGPSGVRVFFRAGGDVVWSDGGVVTPVGQNAVWPLPAAAPDVLDLRVVAADLAGNVAGDEALDIRTPMPVTPPTTPRLAETDTHSSPEAVGVPRPPGAPHEPRVTISAPDPPSPDLRLHGQTTLVGHTSRAALQPASAPAVEHPDRLRVERLRALARRHATIGERALAAARLDEALRLAPEDIETLLDAAEALAADGDLPAAAERYATALRLAPTDARVLDGSAAVTAALGDFTTARQHLLKLIELTPQAGRAWLHYGDVEHRLGRTTAAVAAWRRAVDMAGADDVRESARRRLRLLGPERQP